MIDLNKANKSVWNDYRPKHSVVDTINDKANTANHINDSDFSYIFQYETQYDKNGSRIANISSNLRIHGDFLRITNLIIFNKIIKFFLP